MLLLRLAISLVVVMCVAPLVTAASSVKPDAQSTYERILSSQDAFVSPAAIATGHAVAADAARLETEAILAAGRGVPEKLAIVQLTSRSNPAASATVARHLRRDLGLSGVVVVVTNVGVGLSSDRLSRAELTAISNSSRTRWIRGDYSSAAVFAGRQALARIKADKSASQRNMIFISLAILAVIGLVILFLIRSTLSKRSAVIGRMVDLRHAASNTLLQADDAVTEIESGTADLSMKPEVRAAYERALGLRDRARRGIDAATSPASLTQSNQDAAQAVLGLQSVMRQLELANPNTNLLDPPARRCFYCAHEDRPQYATKTIDDARGNTMTIEVCAACHALLERGRTPRVQTVTHDGSTVPWWAVPQSPWYHGYGGPTWQYWLPFAIGMDVGDWFEGGCTAGSDGSGQDGAGWDTGSRWHDTQAMPSDAGGRDVSGGGGDANWG